MAVLHLEFQLVNIHPVYTCEGANTEVHSRLHESWDREDGVKRTDWAGFFPAAGGAAPQGPVAYNMLVPRRETGTDWKHKPGHPDQSHPRGRRAASLFHDRGGGWTLELHIIRSQHICILIHRSWWQKAFSHRTGTKSKQTQPLSHLPDWVPLLKPAALCMCNEMPLMAAAAGTLVWPAGDIAKLRNTLRIQLRQRRGRVRGWRVQKLAEKILFSLVRKQVEDFSPPETTTSHTRSSTCSQCGGTEVQGWLLAAQQGALTHEISINSGFRAPVQLRPPTESFRGFSSHMALLNLCDSKKRKEKKCVCCKKIQRKRRRIPPTWSATLRKVKKN